MKKLLVGILALLFSFAVFAGTTDLDRLLLHERYGEDPWLGFGEMNDTSGVFTLEYDDADADAVCLLLDLPAGGTDVPVFLLASTSSDYGYFTNVTVPTFAIEDDAGGSYVKLDWTDSNDARLATGGSDVRLDINSPLLGLGYDLSAELLLVVTDTTGIAAMTQTGSGPTMSWTVPVYTFTNSTSMTNYTPSWTLGYDSDAWLSIVVATGTGNVTITQTGSEKSVAWTAAGGFTFTGDFEVSGASTFDGMTISGVITHTNNYNITGDITQTGSTTITSDLDVGGTANLDVVDIQGAVTMGAYDFTFNTNDFVLDADGDFTFAPTGGDITVTANYAITGNTIQTGSITASSDITTTTGNFIMGSTTITETEIGYLDGLTIGVVTASKTVVVDASKDIGDFGSLTAEHLISTDDADINDNLTVGDIIIDEDIGIINHTGEASFSITTQTPSFIGFETATFEHRYSYTGLGYDSAIQTPSIHGLQVQNGEALTCVGLDGGAAEIGTTEGYVIVGDQADFLRFVVPIPCLWVDTGQTASLKIQFDIHEQADSGVCDIGIRIFEYGTNLSAIVDDAIAATIDDTRAWKDLVTDSAGIGYVTTLSADDSYLIIELTAVEDTDDFWIYGIRLLYQTGIQATQ